MNVHEQYKRNRQDKMCILKTQGVHVHEHEQNNKRILLCARKYERPLSTNLHNLLIINKHKKARYSGYRTTDY